MIDNSTSDRNRLINGILIVVAIALLAASIYSVYLAWRTGLAQSRAETASRLMAIRTSPRSTETPGINAWVSWSLLNRSITGSNEENESLRRLVAPRSGNQFPQEFQGLLDVLRTPAPKESGTIEFKTDEQIGGQSDDTPLEFRNVNYVANQDELFVLTARQNEIVQSGIEDFCAIASTHLAGINRQWQNEPDLPMLDDLNRIRSARVARFYVLNEDESLISLPLGESNQNSLHLSEGDEFRKNPLSPSFVSNNFFFDFQFEKPLSEQATYSGMYLDLGGLGLVGSITTPVIYNGKRSVLGADIAFDMDWEQFARNLSPNLISHVAHIGDTDSKSWNPWNEFLSDLGPEKPTLRAGLVELAQRESLNSEPSARKSVYLATTRDEGDLMAIQVNRSTWLLLLVAADEIQLPWMTMLLTSLVFLSLLFRIEQSRRQAIAAQRSARGEMQEKQNLLETMQVPLMVVDPNTDEVVFCNRAAESIGMSQGNFFGKDIVAPGRESQEHYLNNQKLSEEHRRAYGVPIRINGESDCSVNYAIVRSVAVTAPIATLHADERHRLGILFLVDEERDLELLLKRRIAETRQDEKRQLAGLMNHGIDSLARVLNNRIKTTGKDDRQDLFANWISSYLSARIQLVAWTLENWGRSPTTTDKRIIERKTVEMTLANYNEIFQIVAEDRQLREQLHWNNGVVSTDSVSVGPIVIAEIDWLHESCFSVPREGVFGFFLSEVLTNAIRHGKPGSQVKVTITENPIRNEISFVVENEVDKSNRAKSAMKKPLAGTVIVTELARLSGWSPPTFECNHGIHMVQWSIPAIRRMSVDGD